MYLATRYFTPRYFAERYFAGQESVAAGSYSYFAQGYFSKRYFAERYFAGNYSIDPFNKPLFSSLLALSSVPAAILAVDRPLISSLTAQSLVAIASLSSLAAFVSNLVASSSTMGSLVVSRPLVSTLSVSSSVSTANFSLLPSTTSNLIASSAVSVPALRMSRVLTSSLVARSSTEAWSQSVSVSWTDPTPAYTAYYELEYRINSAPSFVISGLVLTSHTWSVRVDVGDVLYVKTRSVSIDMPPVYSDWSEWSDGWTVPETPNRAELILVGGLYSNLMATSIVSNARLGRLQAKLSVLAATSTISSPNLKLTTIPIVSNLVATSIVSSVKLDIWQSKASTLAAESAISSALLAISQAKTSNLTAVSLVSQASLLVASGYPQTSILTAESAVSQASLIVNRSLSGALVAESVTVTSTLVAERGLLSSLLISSTVSSVDLVIERGLSSLLTAESVVSSANLTIAGALVSTLVANSSVSNVSLIVNRPLVSLLVATASITTPTLVTGNLRLLSSILVVESSTLPKPHLVIERGLVTSGIVASTASGKLRVLRALLSALSIDSTVADADLSLTKLLGITSILVATSSISGLRRLTVWRPLSTSLSASSLSSGILHVNRSLQSLLTAVSAVTAIRPATITIAGLLSVEFSEVGTYNGPYLDQDTLGSLNQPALEIGDVA